MKHLTDYSLEEILQGYVVREDGSCQCRVCGTLFEQGEVYPRQGRFFDAQRMIRLHLEEEHPSRLEELMSCPKKYTSLTDNQQELLRLFSRGLSDGEIAKRMGVAASTIRHQRFTFREKARQAKLYLAIYQLALGEDQRKSRDKPGEEQAFVPLHPGATMVDERYAVTSGQEAAVLEAMFASLKPLRLKTFPAREKKKLVVLGRIAEEFQREKRYDEREVNDTLKAIYDDYVTLRRYLIEYGFLERTTDCKEYWVK